jgi:hypothetical protein
MTEQQSLLIQLISGNEKFHELQCIDTEGNPVVVILPISFQCLHPEENGCEAMCPVDIELGGTIKIIRSRPAPAPMGAPSCYGNFNSILHECVMNTTGPYGSEDCQFAKNCEFATHSSRPAPAPSLDCDNCRRVYHLEQNIRTLQKLMQEGALTLSKMQAHDAAIAIQAREELLGKLTTGKTIRRRSDGLVYVRVFLDEIEIIRQQEAHR